jgi:imidazolonepropionase-like amidohydrolase
MNARFGMIHPVRVGAVAALALSTANMALAQTLIGDAPVLALVNVQVISMEHETVEPGQTVLIQGDRIVAVAPLADVPVPNGAMVIDGAGRFVVPGLTDAHVHLTTDMRTRPDFGDAPLYLAHGVTTVINLRGTATLLEWRRRIETGQLTGPTIYTAGEFVNEPRINTPGDAEREVATQANEGFDVIKFHEVLVPGQGYVTTTGLSRSAYMRMVETARDHRMPLVGHAPVNLGLDALLEARQPLAHMGALSNIYFMPLVANRAMLLLTAGASLILIGVVVKWSALAIVRRWRGLDAVRFRPLARLRQVTSTLSVVSLLALMCIGVLLPGGLAFDSTTLRVVLTVLVGVVAALTAAAIMLTVGLWRDANTSTSARLEASLVSAATFGLAVALLAFWVPVAWRSSDGSIEGLANRFRDAGISVQTTLVVYDALNSTARSRLMADPAIEYLTPQTRSQWRQQQFPAVLDLATGRYPEFMRKVAGAFNRAGVLLVAGTDTMGAPLIAPGSSLHRELQLLTESGLTAYEAVRLATVNPAVFLGREMEFGTLAVGKRADLLLIRGNPLESIDRLKQPDGVVVRGRWLSRNQLQEMLEALR